ncbi:MAG: hypothetical protein WBP94_09200 [Rhodomicrobiaceae bacterium]
MRDLFDLYKPLRNKIAELAYLDSFRVLWAYCQFLQIKNFKIPEDIEVHEDVLAAKKPNIIHEWELEMLATEAALNGGYGNRKNKTLRQWSTFAAITQGLRDLEGEVYARHGDATKILMYLNKIIFRQVIWQNFPMRTKELTRQYKIFNTAEINKICKSKLDLSVYQIFFVGLLFTGIYLENPSAKYPPKIEIDNLTLDMIDAFLAFTSLSLSALKKKIKPDHSIDELYGYRFSWLRAYPIIRLSACGEELLACPMPTLLFWRMTKGLYYELINERGFDNAFGASFEQYMGEVITVFVKNKKFKIVPEKKYIAGKNNKATTDWIVDDGGSTLFIECKIKRMTIEAKAFANNLENLSSDISKLADAVVQLYATIIDYQSGLYPDYPHNPDKKIYPLVVTLEDWLLFGEGLKLLDDNVRAKLNDQGRDVSVLDEMPYSIMSSDEFETAIGIINQVGIDAFIGGKVRCDEYKNWHYFNYTREVHKEAMKDIKPPFNEEFDKLFKEFSNT